MPENIFILSAPVGSGKTTDLLGWSERRKDVYGILTPIVDGERMFMDIERREVFPMQANEAEESFDVGRYRFSKTSFEKAVGIIRAAKQKQGWLIIDEIGPLELRGYGFDAVLKEILASEPSLKIVLVVRTALLDEVIDHYRLRSSEVVNVSRDLNFK